MLLGPPLACVAPPPTVTLPPLPSRALLELVQCGVARLCSRPAATAGSHSRPAEGHSAVLVGMGAQQSLQRYQDRRTLEAAAEGRLDGIAVSRDLFEARGLGLIGLPSGLVARMSDVSTVDVSENRFETLPAQICTLSGVKTFLAHDNSLRELPRAFGDLFSLEHLDLSRNALAGSLPPMVGSLKQLRELRLQQNKLTELPDNIGDLVRLERLALDHNNLDSLPSSFTTVRITLRCRTGRLHARTGRGGEGGAKTASCALSRAASSLARSSRPSPSTRLVFCDAARACPQLTSLRDLGISYNVLTSTHEHLDRLTALTRLDLAFNRLTAVPSLEQLTALRTLALESNRLRFPLPPLCLLPLRSLTSLSLGGSDNRLAALPPTWTGNLRELSMPRSLIETRGEGEGAGAAAARVAERAAAAAAADAEVDGELLVDPVHDPRVARVRAGAKVGGRVVTSHQIVVGLASAGSASKEDWAPIDQLRRAQQLATQLSRQQMARMDDEAEEEGVGGGAPSLEAVTAATRARAMSSAREQSAAARRSVPDSARAAPPGGAAGRGEGADDDGDEDDDIDSSQVQLPRLVTLGLSKAGLRHLPAAFGSVSRSGASGRTRMRRPATGPGRGGIVRPRRPSPSDAVSRLLAPARTVSARVHGMRTRPSLAPPATPPHAPFLWLARSLRLSRRWTCRTTGTSRASQRACARECRGWTRFSCAGVRSSRCPRRWEGFLR